MYSSTQGKNSAVDGWRCTKSSPAIAGSSRARLCCSSVEPFPISHHGGPPMAKSSRPAKPLATLTVPMKVEIRQPEFEPLSSLKALDMQRLSKGSHKVEVGFLKGGCCRNLVWAVIRDGMVT